MYFHVGTIEVKAMLPAMICNESGGAFIGRKSSSQRVFRKCGTRLSLQHSLLLVV